MVSVASKLPNRSPGGGDRPYYDEYEFDRKVRKRRARLVSAAEDAFTHIKRIRKDQLGELLITDSSRIVIPNGDS